MQHQMLPRLRNPEDTLRNILAEYDQSPEKDANRITERDAQRVTRDDRVGFRSNRRFQGRRRHLGSLANAAKFTVNVWEKS